MKYYQCFGFPSKTRNELIHRYSSSFSSGQGRASFQAFRGHWQFLSCQLSAHMVSNWLLAVFKPLNCSSTDMQMFTQVVVFPSLQFPFSCSFFSDVFYIVNIYPVYGF